MPPADDSDEKTAKSDLAASEKSDEASETGGESPGGGIQFALRQTAAFQERIAAIRKHSDRVGNAIATVGMGALSALGFAGFVDLFPYEASVGWGVGLLGGFVLIAVGVFTLFWLYNRAQLPLVMVSDVDRLETRGSAERRLALELYDEMAAINGVDTLQAYESRGERLRRVGHEERNESERKRLLEEADVISAEVRETLTRAAHAVIRRRAHRAAAGSLAMVCYALIVVGIGLAAVSHDAVADARDVAEEREQSPRDETNELQRAKACAELAAAGVKLETLKLDCPEVDVPESNQGSGGEPNAESNSS